MLSPLQTEYASLGDKDAAKKFAQEYISCIRSWSNSTFVGALSDSRSDEEKADIMEQFWRKYKNKVTEAPEEHGYSCVFACVRVRKI